MDLGLFRLGVAYVGGARCLNESTRTDQAAAQEVPQQSRNVLLTEHVPSAMAVPGVDT